MLHGMGPFGCAFVQRQSLHGADHLAENHPGRHRIDIARHQRQGDVIEHLDAFVDLPLEDSEPGHRCTADQHRRRHAQALTEIDRLDGVRASRHHVTAPQTLIRPHHGHDCMDRGRLTVGDQSVGAPKPHADRCHETRVDHQVHGDHCCGARRRKIFTSIEVQRVERFPRRHRSLRITSHVRRRSLVLQLDR